MKARKAHLAGAVVAITTLVVAGCGSSSHTAASTTTGSSGSGSNQASAPGVSATTVTVGLVTSLTGSAAPEYVGVEKAAQARFDVQNAKGGVDGRKLELVTKDDTSSPAGNATATKFLASDNVFAVIGETAFLFGGYKSLQQAGIPVVGGGYDGPEWGQQPNTNMFTFAGTNGTAAGTDPHSPQYTLTAQFIKDQGGTNAASFGYGESPSSTAAAKGFAFSAKSVGIKAGLVDTSIPFGSVNAAPIALEMNHAGIDSAYLPMDNNTNFAIITAAKQAGVDLKVAVSATGYGQSLLDDSSAVAAANGTYFSSECAPTEIDSAATKAMQAGLAKYASFTGVPGFDYCQGWVSADMIIKGLETAGANPTRQSFINGLHGVADYTAGGLLPTPVNFSLSSFGTAPPTACGYFVKLSGSSFVPVPADGKPSCGTLIPNSDQQ